MRKRNFKGRCTKRYVPKCMDICRTYDALSDSYRKSEYQLLPQEIMLQRIKQERR